MCLVALHQKASHPPRPVRSTDKASKSLVNWIVREGKEALLVRELKAALIVLESADPFDGGPMKHAASKAHQLLAQLQARAPSATCAARRVASLAKLLDKISSGMEPNEQEKVPKGALKQIAPVLHDIVEKLRRDGQCDNAKSLERWFWQASCKKNKAAAEACSSSKKRKRCGKTKACKQQEHEDADSGSQEHEDADSGSQGKGGEGAAAEVEAEVEGAQTEEEEAAAFIKRSAAFLGFMPGEDEGLHIPSIHEVKCLGAIIKGLSDVQASQVTMNWLFKRPAEAKEHIATIVAASQHCLTLEVDLPWCGPKANYLLGTKDTIAQDLNKRCTLDVYCNDYQEHHNVGHDQVRVANSVRNRRGGLRAAK